MQCLKVYLKKPSEALREMINDLLSLGIESVDDIQISNTEQSIESNEQNKSVVDLNIRTNKGFVIVEMQVYKDKDFMKRAGLYIARSISNQHVKSSKEQKLSYNDIVPVYQILFLDYVEYDDERLYHYYTFEDVEYINKRVSLLNRLVIELPKISHYDESDSKNKWSFFFSKNGIINKSIIESMGKNMTDLFKRIELLSQDEIMQARYIREQDEIDVKYTNQKYYEDMLEEERQKTKIAHNEGVVAGRAEGIVTGRAEGIVTGRVEGIEVGRAEGIETGRAESRIAFAKTLLNNNEPMDKIILYTGLTIDEINELK